MTLCTVYDGCSAKKEETLPQNYLQTYLNSISFASCLISYYPSLSFHYVSPSFATSTNFAILK